MIDLNQLGLDERVVAGARHAGYEHATPLQSAAIPVLRRGSNAVLHASAGAGVIAAFGLSLLDRLLQADHAEGVRALVVTPTPERADAIAAALSAMAAASGVAVRATGAGWKLADATVLVASAAQLLQLVQDSSLKLDAVQTLVMLDVNELLAVGHGDALESLIPLIPREAQRVVTTGSFNPTIDKFVDAHARRALTIPARPADPVRTAAQEPDGQIGYAVVAEQEKTEIVARLLESVEEPAVVYVRTAARANRVQQLLRQRGVAGGSHEVQVISFGADADVAAWRVISHDVPFSADQLQSYHARGGTVLVTPQELPHLQRIAAESSYALKHRRIRTFERDPLDHFRASIRAALESEDLHAQLLVLEPLLEERSAAEVAAALCGMLRRRTPARSAAVESGAAPATAAPRAASPATFTRLFVSIGTRDNVRPGDLVGAITGEAGIKGDQVGRVDIRDTFSVVEVAAGAAEKVIRALNGTTMRGRSLRVDFDRKTGASSDDHRGVPRAARGAKPADRTPRERPPRDREAHPRDRGPRDRPPRNGPKRGPRDR